MKMSRVAAADPVKDTNTYNNDACNDVYNNVIKYDSGMSTILLPTLHL
jgi:hypothetical protein